MEVNQIKPSEIDPVIIATKIKFAPKDAKIKDTLAELGVADFRARLIKQGLCNAGAIEVNQKGQFSVIRESFNVSEVAKKISDYVQLPNYVAADTMLEALHMIPDYWIDFMDFFGEYKILYPNKTERSILMTLDNLVSLGKLERLKEGEHSMYKKISDFSFEEVQTIKKEKFLNIMSKEVRVLKEVTPKKDKPKVKYKKGGSVDKAVKAMAKLRSAGKIKYGVIEFLKENNCSYYVTIAKYLTDNNYIFKDGEYIEWNKSMKNVSIPELAESIISKKREKQNKQWKKRQEKSKNNLLAEAGVQVTNVKSTESQDEVISSNLAKVGKEELFDLLSESVMLAHSTNNRFIQEKVKRVLDSNNLNEEFKGYLVKQKFGYLDK